MENTDGTERREVRFGKDIFPDLTLEKTEEIKKFEKKYKIRINFLFDEGISIELSDDYRNADEMFSSLRLVDIFGGTVLRISEDFGAIIFYNNLDEKVLEIPILEGGI